MAGSVRANCCGTCSRQPSPTAPLKVWSAASIDPADAPRAVREYLDTQDEAAFGAASESKKNNQKQSLTKPAHPCAIVVENLQIHVQSQPSISVTAPQCIGLPTFLTSVQHDEWNVDQSRTMGPKRKHL